MKKIFFSVATAMILSAGWAMYSCSNDDELEILQTPSAPETVDVAPEQRLINGLQELNEQLLAERPELETRGRFWNWVVKNKITIVDAIGAVSGYFLCDGVPLSGKAIGAAASYFCFGKVDTVLLPYLKGGTRATTSDEFSDLSNRLVDACGYADRCKDSLPKDYLPVDVHLNFPEEYAGLPEEIAAHHNLILDILLNDSVDLSSEKYALSEEDLHVLESDVFINGFNYMMPYFANMDLSFIDTTKLEYAVLKKFCELYEEYSYESEDVNFIINKYIEYLESDGTLTKSEREAVYIGLAVAAYSNDYWNKMYLKEKSGE